MFLFLWNELRQGKSFARALMNAEVRAHTVRGKTLDVGGGKHQDYFLFLQGTNTATIQTVDLVPSETDAKPVNFEHDALPYPDHSFDTVIVFNVFEHIYHHTFLAQQIQRVLKQDGTVLGFVPFLVNYHPDPRDYFRYTKEALRQLFSETRFQSIKIDEIGRGPFAVNYNNIVLSLPRIARLILFPVAYALDSLFLRLRPKVRERYPLGYFFLLKK